METQSPLMRGKRERKGFAGFVFGLAAGVVGMYLLDGRSGARRRALIRDRFSHWRKIGFGKFGKRSRDLGNRLSGLTAEVSHVFEHEENVDDQTLAERIRSKIGRVVSHPKTVQVECHDGKVQLSGYALASEIPRLYESVRHVRGVRSIVVNDVKPTEEQQPSPATSH